jgi:two-component system repressor protein LuxO
MMQAPPPRILLVEDAPETVDLVRAQLTARGFAVRHVPDGPGALRALSEAAFDVVLLDLGLPGIGGLDVLREIRARRLPAAVVVLTGDASVDTAVAAMRAGAMDYLVKPCDPTRLEVTLRNVLERQSLNSLVESYRERYEGDGFCDFIGSSPAMQAVYRTIEAAAASIATIFITGESGTGKELCAAAIHKLSARRDKPFAVLNCAAIPPTLMESELFGHTKGAFTGATAARAGVVRRAHGGTLFLDEICDMPLELQAKLLRLVQTGSFRAVGSDTTETADLRFVCATNRDPLAEVAAARFREDLFYRMHVIPIHMPPLRERGNDVLAIAARLLADYSRGEGRLFEEFSPEAAESLLAYPWPGNVRELQNTIRRVVVLNEGRVVSAAMLPEPVRGAWRVDAVRHWLVPRPQAPANRSTARAAGPIQPLRLVEDMAIEEAIALCGGNIRRAAALLKVSPSTIYRKRRRAHAASNADPGAGGAPAPAGSGPAARRPARAGADPGRPAPKPALMRTR